MTVTYTAQVATSRFGCFMKLLARWRGSIYKLLWRDFIVFAALYFLLSFIYRFALNEEYKRIFEMIVKYCELRNALIPVAFILGFYVNLVMTRYWAQLGHIPWPDHMAMFVTANVHGRDDRGRALRRTMMRYINLAYAITMMSISTSVAKRFKSYKEIVEAGIMTPNEKKILEELNSPNGKFFIPLAWTTSLVTRARREGRIKDDFAVKTLIDEINQFRMNLATLFVYDMISMPLVYTQVVTIAVYTFFLACLMGRQFVDNDPNVPDVYFPVFTFLEYLFYMGWLKVAESFVNPFGEDDDDFDMNFLIDRNLQVSYMIVDGVHDEPPELIRDQYWDSDVFDMPYASGSEQFRLKNPLLQGSAVDLTSLAKEKETLPQMEPIDELEEVTDGRHGDAPGSSPSYRPLLPSSGSYGVLTRPSQAGRRSQRPSLSRLGGESPVARSYPGPSFTVGSVDAMFPPSSPTMSMAGNNNNLSPPLSPLTPVIESMQFPMDFEEPKKSYPLIPSPPSPDTLPPEVFEMEAILARSHSGSLGTLPPKTTPQPPKTDIPQTQTQQQLSNIEEQPERDDVEGDHSNPRNTLGLTLTIPVAERKEPKEPEMSDTTTPLLFIDEDDTKLVAGAKEDNSGNQQRKVGKVPSLRIVAPPTMSPDVPMSPALTSPIWVTKK